MKGFLLTAAAAILLASPAFAGECPRHVRAVDEALAKNPQLSAVQMTEVKKARDEGDSLHRAGRHADSLRELAKAEQVLKIGM